MSYYLDHDGHGDLTLWRNDPGQPYPQPIAVRHDCDHEVWSLLLRGAGLHDCQPGTQQVCNTCLGIPSVPHIDPDEECWCHLGIKDVCDVCQYASRPEPPDTPATDHAELKQQLGWARVRVWDLGQQTQRLAGELTGANIRIVQLQRGRDEADAERDEAKLAEARLRDHRGPADPGDTVVILRQRGTYDGDAQYERIVDAAREAITNSGGEDEDDLAASAVLDALRQDAKGDTLGDRLTAEHNARVARRNANAARITHEDGCVYPGEVDDTGLRCTECGAEATR